MQAVYVLLFSLWNLKTFFGSKLESQKQAVYLLQAAHEVVANGRSGQVGCARASSDIEKVIRA